MQVRYLVDEARHGGVVGHRADIAAVGLEPAAVTCHAAAARCLFTLGPLSALLMSQARTAKAAAALAGRLAVEASDLWAAAQLVILPRAPRVEALPPPSSPQMSEPLPPKNEQQDEEHEEEEGGEQQQPEQQQQARKKQKAADLSPALSAPGHGRFGQMTSMPLHCGSPVARLPSHILFTLRPPSQ